MAEVSLARSAGIEGFERIVVAKRIRAEQARDQQYVRMFLDEARLAASLHHHNIVQVHDIGQEGGEYFFTMEYIHGEDLRKLLTRVSDREEQVPIDHLVTIGLAVASALHFAHEQHGADRKPLGLVHRDVSPANIIVGYDGNVKVVDFGIAKAAQHTIETQSGALKGKVAYMSPEQCVGSPLDRRSDIYSLGIVLYELATVRRLFKGDSDFMTMSAIVHGKIPSPGRFRSDMPRELVAIIEKALAFTPATRFQTADELRLALQTIPGIHTSTTALADYMTSLFGQRPMPWLVETEEGAAEMSVDFDGSGSGVVHLAEDILPDVFAPSANSPIMQARTWAVTEAPPSIILGESVAATPTSVLVEDELEARVQTPRRTWLIVAALVAPLVMAVIVVVIAVTRSPASSDSPSALPATSAVVQPTASPPVVEPRPAPPEPKSVVVPPDAGATIAVSTPKPLPVAPRQPPAMPPATPPPPPPPPKPGGWDKNSLFPRGDP